MDELPSKKPPPTRAEGVEEVEVEEEEVEEAEEERFSGALPDLFSFRCLLTSLSFSTAYNNNYKCQRT